MKKSRVANYIANMFYERGVDAEEADELGMEVLNHLIDEFGLLPPPNSTVMNYTAYNYRHWEKETENE